MKNLRWTQILISLIVGLAMGGGICAIQNHWRFTRHWDSEKKMQRMLHKFSSRLDLMPEQEKQVSVILENKRQKIDALRAQVHPQFEEVRNATRDEIRKLLNPDQQKKFEKLDAELRARRDKH